MSVNPVSADQSLKMFNDEISSCLGNIAEWLGLPHVTLQMEPKLVRHQAKMKTSFAFSTEKYQTLTAGRSPYAEIPIYSVDDALEAQQEGAQRLFRRATSKDALLNDIVTGQLGGDGRYVCDEVVATSQETCDGCSGNGAVSCSPCFGHGTITCTNCQFGAYRGMVTCWACHGQKGNYDHDGKWYNCSRCGGWGRTYCGTCGGSEKVRCTICGGDGNATCGSCSGHGFFTRAYAYRIRAWSVAQVSSKTMQEIHLEGALVWLKKGLPGRTAQQTGTVIPHADLENAVVAYDGWKDGVFSATLSFDSRITTGDFAASYGGAPIGDVAYVRLSQPLFGFPSFCNEFVYMPMQAIAAKGDMRPSDYLAHFDHMPGMAICMRESGTSMSAKAKALDDAKDVLSGSVATELLESALDGYLGTIGAMEKDVSGSVARDTALGLAGLWVGVWFFGLFDALRDMDRDQAIGLSFLLTILLASLTGGVVKGLTRRRIRAETGVAARYGLGRLGKFLCFLGALVFVYGGLFEAAIRAASSQS